MLCDLNDNFAYCALRLLLGRWLTTPILSEFQKAFAFDLDMKDIKMTRTVLGLFICISFLFGTASASPEAIDPPSYAVLSLIGDNLSLVVYNGATGSNLSSTRKELVQISAPVFDDSALRGVAEAIAQFQSNATEKLISTNAPALYKLQNEIFASSSDGQAARETIRAMLKDTPVSRLIVITKYESDAHLKLPALYAFAGSGKLDGIGYYIDDWTRVRAESGDKGRGFLSSFAYIRATLLDAKTLEVIGDQVNISSEPTLNLRTELHAWNVLSDEQKTASLQKIVRVATHDAALNLLKATSATN
jgi:hypothetical protein